MSESPPLRVHELKSLASDDMAPFFVMTVPRHFTPKAHDHIRALFMNEWDLTGRSRPGLVLLQEGMTIEALTPGALRDHGLVRLEAQTAQACGEP